MEFNNYKKLNKEQAQALKRYGYNVKEFRFVNENATTLSFYHIRTGRQITIRR